MCELMILFVCPLTHSPTTYPTIESAVRPIICRAVVEMGETIPLTCLVAYPKHRQHQELILTFKTS